MDEPKSHRFLEFALLPEGAKLKPMTTHNRMCISHVGQLAIELVKNASVTLLHVGETSKGDAVVRVLNPQEAVDRAFEIAEMTFARLEKEGWVTPLPPIKTLIDENHSKAGFRGGDA